MLDVCGALLYEMYVNLLFFPHGEGCCYTILYLALLVYWSIKSVGFIKILRLSFIATHFECRAYMI